MIPLYQINQIFLHEEEHTCSRLFTFNNHLFFLDIVRQRLNVENHLIYSRCLRNLFSGWIASSFLVDIWKSNSNYARDEWQNECALVSVNRWRKSISQNVWRTKRIVSNKSDKQIAINPYHRLWFINLYNFTISNSVQSNVTNRCNQMGDSAQVMCVLHNKVMTAFDWFVHYIKLE